MKIDQKTLLASVLSLTIGSAAGYVTASKILQKTYDERLEEEIRQTKIALNEQFKMMNYAAKDVADSASLENDTFLKDGADKALAALAKYAGGETAEAPNYDDVEKDEDMGPALKEVTQNVFTDSDDDFDYDEELPKRTPDRPYVISFEEFSEGVVDYEQSTLTYYQGDDALAEMDDKLVEDTDRVVGDSNLLKFGHGSKDKRVVYVRNERMSQDFEILLHDGEYKKDVLGFIEHSDHRPKILRFRDDDE